MTFKKLHINFFDSFRSTEESPYIHEETISYEEKILQEYVEIGISATSFEINKKYIYFEDFEIEINSKYICYREGFTIELKVNGFLFFNSLNLRETGYSGTILISKTRGFHYALIG